MDFQELLKERSRSAVNIFLRAWQTSRAEHLFRSRSEMDQFSSQSQHQQVRIHTLYDLDHLADIPRRLSVPMTKYTKAKATNLPKKALTNLKRLIGEMFPDLTVGL